MLTGVNDLFGAAYTRIPDSMFLTVFLLFITPLTARGIYSKTRNPYLGGMYPISLVWTHSGANNLASPVLAVAIRVLAAQIDHEIKRTSHSSEDASLQGFERGAQRHA